MQQQSCDVSTKLKNLKATHNRVVNWVKAQPAVMYPQS